MSSKPLYEVGQEVYVVHHSGSWNGTITHRNLVDYEWEYEVSNAPEHHPDNPAGYQWYPLLWEAEVKGVV